jgi:hypothetical protein
MNAAEQVDELAAAFGADDAQVAWLLCDRHPADDVAFTAGACPPNGGLLPPLGAVGVSAFLSY